MWIENWLNSNCNTNKIPEISVGVTIAQLITLYWVNNIVDWSSNGVDYYSDDKDDDTIILEMLDKNRWRWFRVDLRNDSRYEYNSEISWLDYINSLK